MVVTPSWQDTALSRLVPEFALMESCSTAASKAIVDMSDVPKSSTLRHLGCWLLVFSILLSINAHYSTLIRVEIVRSSDGLICYLTSSFLSGQRLRVAAAVL